MEVAKIRKFEIVKFDLSNRKHEKIEDYVAEEKPFNIFINKKHYVTILCSPSNLKEMAVGHLLSEGIIKSAEEIEEIHISTEGKCKIKLNINLEKRIKLFKPYSRIILSACGSTPPNQFIGKLPKITSNIQVKAEVILESVRQLNMIAETFRKTGGVHIAAIYKNDGTLLAFAEDVGRHNAVDKTIGAGALEKVNFAECFLALSGRLSGDIVLKAARMKIPIVASLATAIDSGIVLAKNLGLTLIGFARGNRMNIYTFPERILS